MQFFTIRQYILFAQNFCVSYLFERTLQSLSSKSQCPLPPSSSKLRCTYIAWRSSKASAWNRVPFQRTSEQRQQKCNELKKKFFFLFFFCSKMTSFEKYQSWANCYKRCIVTKHKNLILHLLIDEKLFYQSTKNISKNQLPLENYLEKKISRFFINSFLILKDSELHMHYQSFLDKQQYRFINAKIEDPAFKSICSFGNMNTYVLHIRCMTFLNCIIIKHFLCKYQKKKRKKQLISYFIRKTLQRERKK